MKDYSMAYTVDCEGRLSHGEEIAFFGENRDFGVLMSLIETTLT
jgi:hypothetical protein